MDRINKTLSYIETLGLYPARRAISEGVNEPECVVDGKRYLMFSANNYLGLSHNPKVIEAGRQALTKYGAGPGGSRVISGNVEIIEELERKIASLTGTEDCLTFPTGYMANIAIFGALMDPLLGDLPAKRGESVIFSDEFNHGSIVDGCKLSTAKKVIFKHDNLDDLQKKISENDLPNKLIVTESVFSLEGEITNIPRYIEIAKAAGAQLMVDDAHGVGIIGRNGGGVGMHFECSKDIDILMGCMDKAFGGTGGYLCGSHTLIKYLRITARSSLLSSALPAGMAGAMREAVDQIEGAKELRSQLFEKAQYLRDQLKKMGFKILGNDIIPAIPLFLGLEENGIQFANLLWKEGIFCPEIRWPAVPQGQSRLRIIVMVTHAKKHLDHFLDACKKAGKNLHMIK